MKKVHDPAAACCPHPKKKHRTIGFKPCTVDGCTCVSFWRQRELEAAKP